MLQNTCSLWESMGQIIMVIIVECRKLDRVPARNVGSKYFRDKKYLEAQISEVKMSDIARHFIIHHIHGVPYT